MDDIKTIIDQHCETVQSLHSIQDNIYKLANQVINTIERGNKVLVMGNGGSAADSQHFAAEIVGKFHDERKGYPCIALTTDTSVLTSLSNDYSYEQVFAHQVEALANEKDLVMGISTSGDSTNVIQAIEIANKKRCFTVGLLGDDGGELNSMADLSIVPPSSNTARIQECHILVLHIVCHFFDEHFNE